MRGKLNINSLIYKKQMNSSIEVNGIKITVIAREVYKDNEKYQIKISNKTDKTILIDTGNKANGITLTANGMEYNSNVRELASFLRTVNAGFTRTITLKFNKIYSVKADPQGITFTDIVPDYEKYQQKSNEAKERIKISVSL